MQPFLIYNTLTRQKELFRPLVEGRVGMYVCGPTVYGDAHLGHARPAITFDLLFRYLKHQGYKVRYVRNITDVGHLEHDADEGEDKIAKKARLEQLEPMEVAQYYTNRFHDAMAALNCLPPSIEPHATGHIIEQQQLVQKIMDNGYAYESNGSIYFDIERYNQDHKYGILSGRSLENIKDASRDTLAGVGEKRNQADFALWKKASPEHIMHWPSPWSEGFPGWHCECTAMGKKYLGERFDIHGGGLDLVFPHHECEIAQAQASQGHPMVTYWMHNNMITIDGKKMGKSYNNFITLPQFFAGEHERLERGYSPMTIRFFILQAHYRSTVDFSNEALQSAEKGLARLMDGWKALKRLKEGQKVAVDTGIKEVPNAIGCYTICGALMGLVGFLYAVRTTSIDTSALNFGSIGIMFTAFLPMFIGGYISRFSNEKLGFFLAAVCMSMLNSTFAVFSNAIKASTQSIINAVLLVVIVFVGHWIFKIYKVWKYGL